MVAITLFFSLVTITEHGTAVYGAVTFSYMICSRFLIEFNKSIVACCRKPSRTMTCLDLYNNTLKES